MCLSVICMSMTGSRSWSYFAIHRVETEPSHLNVFHRPLRAWFICRNHCMLKGCVCACTCVSKHVCLPKVDVHDLASPFMWRCNCEGIHVLLPHLNRFCSALLQIHHILWNKKSKVDLVHVISCCERILNESLCIIPERILQWMPSAVSFVLILII